MREIRPSGSEGGGTELNRSSLPLSKKTAQETRPTGLVRQVQERVERWLDQGMGSCLLRQASLAACLTSAMHHFDGDRYELDCYAVMPNHAHVIVRPLMPEVYPLETIVGGWKKYSAADQPRAATSGGSVAG